MTKRVIAILFASLLLLCAACGKGGDAPGQTANDTPDDLPGITDDPAPPEDDKPKADIPGSTAVDGGPVRMIDASLLTDNGMTVENIFACSDDTILVFASSLSSGVVSEQTWLYPYSVSDDAFTGDSIPIGLIGQYPTCVFDDGTVMLLIQNSETYEFSTMLFIDPDSLACEEYDISSLPDLRSIDVSPDKRLAAVSTYDRMYISDMSFENELASFDGFVPEGGDQEADFHLPCATSWLPDGSGVIGRVLGWEWVYYPFFMDKDGNITELTEYEYLTPIPCGGRDILMCDYFSAFPKGILDLNSMEYTAFPSDGLPGEDDDMNYISAETASACGAISVASAFPDSQDTIAEVRFYRGTEFTTSFALKRGQGYPASFEASSISPSGGLAVMMTGATVDSPKVIYFTPSI